ncbi:MAG: ferrous iron transport protein B [Negativicutes bacterium]|nr:ferrous iron transport protein B [Negativicutes bacterium]
MATKGLTVALAGNPNSGKTTIFNNITGSRQHVGNYPGVTVEKREGFRRFQGKDLLVVDLPGTYSLTAQALDELVARNVIINEKPDVIVNILDASNLERNLYLAVQLLELERPAVLALNMTDVAENMGVKINDQALAAKLGAPVVRTVGNRNRGTDGLLETVLETSLQNQYRPFSLDYGSEIETKIQQISDGLGTLAEIRYPVRWLAIKLLESDEDANRAVSQFPGGEQVLLLVEEARAELSATFGEELELVIAERRYCFVGEVYSEIASSRNDLSQTTSDKIDRILTHRLLGLPIFFGVMWLLFNMVFTVGHYPQDWIQDGAKWLGEWAGRHMGAGDLKSLVVDGIIGGVGTVVSFLPQILLLFLGIALLEDTGYMARAAFVMDRAMRAVGLHGKAFIPLLLGFGCNIPAIMGARTLENPRDRMVTILVAPLMSCSARLPVYTLLTASFFSARYAGSVMFSIYLLGILLAVVMALVFRKILFPGAAEPFAMEMPQYHLPTLRSILTHMWERSVLYLKKAGTVILAVSILVWFFVSYPNDVPYSKDFNQLKETAEITFTEQVAEKVLAPLHLEQVEDNTQLQALISQINDIKAQEEKDDADKDPAPITAKEAVNKADADSAEAEQVAAGETALADAEEAPDNPQLAELKQANPTLYSYAMTYWKLDDERKDAVEKLDQEKASEKLANSYAGRFGHFIEPAIKPLGFDWKMGVSLFAGFSAKEVFISTMGTVYSVGQVDEDTKTLQSALTADPAFTPLVAYTLMVFALIYTPCMAAVAVIRRETNSWKWAMFSVGYSLVLAWVVSFGVYRMGLLLGY